MVVLELAERGQGTMIAQVVDMTIAMMVEVVEGGCTIVVELASEGECEQDRNVAMVCVAILYLRFYFNYC